MKMKQYKTYLVNTRLTDDQYKKVMEFAEKEREGNVSAALRKIVDEWVERKQDSDNKAQPTS